MKAGSCTHPTSQEKNTDAVLHHEDSNAAQPSAIRRIYANLSQVLHMKHGADVSDALA